MPCLHNPRYSPFALKRVDGVQAPIEELNFQEALQGMIPILADSIRDQICRANA